MISNGIGILAIAGSLLGGALLANEASQDAKAPAAGTKPVIAGNDTQRTVSIYLANATVKDVFDQLAKQGINFAASPTGIPEATRVTLNIQSRPLSEVLEAIGTALGGRFTKHGETYAFTRGFAPTQWIFEGGDMSKFDKEFELEMKKMAEELKKSGTAHKLDEKSAKELELKAKQMSEKLAKEFQNKDWSKYMDEKALVGPDADWKFYVDGKLIEPKDLKSDPKLKAKLEERIKDLKLRGPLKPDTKLWDGKALESLQTFTFNGGLDAKKFIGSLTPVQKEKMKKDGYLTPRDLTEAQLKMLGEVSKSGNWSISFAVDGESVTIKSDK